MKTEFEVQEWPEIHPSSEIFSGAKYSLQANKLETRQQELFDSVEAHMGKFVDSVTGSDLFTKQTI